MPGNDAKITRALLDALSVRYASPEWLVWEEITLDGVGRVDALAVGAYESSGHPIHGFEVKASRRDWQREMLRMGKSNAAFVYCDRWFLVTAPGVVHAGELPKGWGHLELLGDQLRIRVKATPLVPSKELSLTHMIRMARRTRRTESDEVSESYQRGFEAGQKARTPESIDAMIDRGRLALLDQFENDLDMHLSSFNVKDIAAAVRYAIDRDTALRRTVRVARWQAQKLLDDTAWVEVESEARSG